MLGEESARRRPTLGSAPRRPKRARRKQPDASGKAMICTCRVCWGRIDKGKKKGPALPFRTRFPRSKATRRLRQATALEPDGTPTTQPHAQAHQTHPPTHHLQAVKKRLVVVAEVGAVSLLLRHCNHPTHQTHPTLPQQSPSSTCKLLGNKTNPNPRPPTHPRLTRPLPLSPPYITGGRKDRPPRDQRRKRRRPSTASCPTTGPPTHPHPSTNHTPSKQ